MTDYLHVERLSSPVKLIRYYFLAHLFTSRTKHLNSAAYFLHVKSVLLNFLVYQTDSVEVWHSYGALAKCRNIIFQAILNVL